MRTRAGERLARAEAHSSFLSVPASLSPTTLVRWGRSKEERLGKQPDLGKRLVCTERPRRALGARGVAVRPACPGSASPVHVPER